MILGTGWRRYSWDDTSGAGELISDNRAGGEMFFFVYGPDGMPCEQLDTNGGTTTEVWLHQDATGSVGLSTDSAGNQTSTQSYDPWGNVTATTGTPAQLGYDSEPVDPTGLIYLQARYYDPATGQFLSVDPLFAATLSAYGCAANDPINGSDPTGLSTCGHRKSVWDAVGSVVDFAAKGGHHMAHTLYAASWAQAHGPSPTPSAAPKVVRDNSGMQVLGGDRGTVGCAVTMLGGGMPGAPPGASELASQVSRTGGDGSLPGLLDCLRMFCSSGEGSPNRPTVPPCGPVAPYKGPYVWNLDPRLSGNG